MTRLETVIFFMDLTNIQCRRMCLESSMVVENSSLKRLMLDDSVLEPLDDIDNQVHPVSYNRICIKNRITFHTEESLPRN